jgi:exosortase family protein XrtM
MKLREPLRFALRFLVGFAVLVGGFEAARGTRFEQFLVEDLVIRPAAAVVNSLTPADRAWVQGRTLASASASLLVTRGCEGVEIVALLVAAIAAYPANLQHKLPGLLAGCLLAYALSVGRLVALHYTLQDHPASWEAMHGVISPLAPVILMGLFFSRWIAWVSATRAFGAPGAA